MKIQFCTNEFTRGCWVQVQGDGVYKGLLGSTPGGSTRDYWVPVLGYQN